MLKRFSVPGKAGLFVVKKHKNGDDSDQKRTDCKRSSSRAVDASSIHIVPKNHIIDPASSSSSLHSATSLRSVGARRHAQDSVPQGLPFEQTFRLQVNLPKNQIAVIRVGPRTILGEVRLRVCQDRDLDPAKYELRHAVNLDERLNEDRSVTDYRLSEVALVPVNRTSSVVVSRSDIYEASSHAAAMMMLGDASKTGTMSTYKSKSSMGESSASSDSLDDLSTARSLSPPFSIPEAAPASEVQTDGLRPRVPPRARKRPAPAPPAPVSEPSDQNVRRDGHKLSHASSTASSVGKALLSAPTTKTSTPKRDDSDGDSVRPFDQSGLTNLTSIPSTSMLSVTSSVALGQPGGVPAPVMPPGVRKRKGKAPPPPPVSNMLPPPAPDVVADAVPEQEVSVSVAPADDIRVSVQVHSDGQAEEVAKQLAEAQKVVDAPEAIDASSEQTDEPTASNQKQPQKRVFKASQSVSSEYFDAETGLTPVPPQAVETDPTPVRRSPSLLSVTSSTSSSFSSEFAISLQRAEKEKKRLKKKKKKELQMQKTSGKSSVADSEEDEVLREDDRFAENEAEGHESPTMEKVDGETTVLEVPSILPDPPTPFKDPSQRQEVDSAIQVDCVDNLDSSCSLSPDEEKVDDKPEPEVLEESSPEAPAVAEKVVTVTAPVVEKEATSDEEKLEALETDELLPLGRSSACRTNSVSSNSTVASAALPRERASSAADSLTSGQSTPPPLPKTPVPTGDAVSELVELQDAAVGDSGSSRSSWDSNCEGEARNAVEKKENVSTQDIAIQAAPSDLIGFTIASYGGPAANGADTAGHSTPWNKDEGSRWHAPSANAVMRRRDSSLSSSSASSVGRAEAKQLRDDRVKSMIDFVPSQVAGSVSSRQSLTVSEEEEEEEHGWEPRPMKSLTSIGSEQSPAVWKVEPDSSRAPESDQSGSVASSRTSDIVVPVKSVRPRSTYETSHTLWGSDGRGKDRSSSSASGSSSSSVRRTSSDADFFEGDKQQASGSTSVAPLSLSHVKAPERNTMKFETKITPKRSSSVMDLATPASSLQSVQVVRDLLPQISQSTARLQDIGIEKPKEEDPKPKDPEPAAPKRSDRVSSESEELEEEVRRYKYRGPPKITLASWQERRPQGIVSHRFRTEDLGGATSQRVPRIEAVVPKGVKPAAVKPQESLEERPRAVSVASSSSDEAQSLPSSVEPPASAGNPPKEPSKTRVLRDTIVAQASKPACDSSLGFNEETGLRAVVKPRPASENSGKPPQSDNQPAWLKKANSIASNYAKAANAAPPAPVIQNQSTVKISAPIVVAVEPTIPEVPVNGDTVKIVPPPPVKPLPKVVKVKKVQQTDANLSEQIMKEFKAKSTEMRQRNGWELAEASGGQQPPKVVGVQEKVDAPNGAPPPPPPPPGVQGLSNDPSRTRTGKRIVPSRSAVQMVDPRGDLLAAIREHGGRGNLRKMSSTPWMKP